MLHPRTLQLLPFLLLVFTTGEAPAQSRNAEFQGVITAVDRDLLGAFLGRRTVVVRRKQPTPKGMTVPGGVGVVGFGWIEATGRVITSARLTAGWPEGDADKLEVEMGDGRRYRAGVGIQEAQLGLSVLDVPGLEGPAHTDLREPNVGKRVLRGGRSLYGLSSTGGLARFVVDGPAQGPWAYFWGVTGPGAPGTPLVDATGRLVTMIVRFGGPTLSQVLIAPTRALAALY